MQLTNHASPNSTLTGRSSWEQTTALQVRDGNTCSMRLSHVRLKVRDLNYSIQFYTSILGLRLTEQTGRHAFLAAGAEHHSVALEEIGTLAIAPSRCAMGVSRVGFEVPDRAAFVAAHDRLWRFGMPIISGDNGISWVMRFEDPDGNEIEIYLDRRKAPDGTALWEGRWQAFKIPKPFVPPRSEKPTWPCRKRIMDSAAMRHSLEQRSLVPGNPQAKAEGKWRTFSNESSRI
jgi:catechol 2,3-dioxygenase-like lactoylglutathione lyase family enzyme